MSRDSLQWVHPKFVGRGRAGCRAQFRRPYPSHLEKGRGLFEHGTGLASADCAEGERFATDENGMHPLQCPGQMPDPVPHQGRNEADRHQLQTGFQRGRARQPRFSNPEAE